MQRRDFYFLVPTGLVLMGAVIVEMVLGGRGPIQVPAPKPVFPGLADHLDELAWVRISRGAAKVDLANVAGRWVVVQKDNYPAAPARFRRLLLGLASLTVVEPGAPDAGSPTRLGLDNATTGEPTRFVLRARTGNTAAEATIAAVPVAAAAAAPIWFMSANLMPKAPLWRAARSNCPATCWVGSIAASSIYRRRASPR